MQENSISRWAVHRRLYDWVLALAHHKHAETALFALAIAESSFFPVAPDVLQIALTFEHRKNAWRYALINSVGSVLGGMVGYFIGAVLWHLTSSFFLTYIFSEATFNHVDQLYHTWSFWAVFVAAFTPIPYKVFTIAAGVFKIPFGWFVLASIVGRSARFFLVAFLLTLFGHKIKNFIEKYFNLVTLLFVLLIVLGFILLDIF